MNDTCKNCGGPRGIHHYETGQCPINGVEHTPDVWTWTTYEAEDNTAARLAAAEELAELANQIILAVEIEKAHIPADIYEGAKVALAKWQEANQ